MIAACFALVLVSSQLLLQRAYRPSGTVAIAFWMCAAAARAGSWYLTNAEYVKPHTLLVEQQRWNVSPVLNETRGVAFMDGQLFITDYRSGAVVATDPVRKASRLVFDRVSASPSDHPSDVQVGPDMGHSGVRTERMMEFFIENLIVRGASAPTSQD